MNATDKELLEMAARAAGLSVTFCGEYFRHKSQGYIGQPWDPLVDDGDALRLAVSLDIHVKRYAGATTAQVLCSNESTTEHDHWARNGNDPMMSTRRAIVICAAEIGKSMTKESDHEH
jgi:hypothetical protein